MKSDLQSLVLLFPLRSSAFPTMSLGYTILGQICDYETVCVVVVAVVAVVVIVVVAVVVVVCLLLLCCC